MQNLVSENFSAVYTTDELQPFSQTSAEEEALTAAVAGASLAAPVADAEKRSVGGGSSAAPSPTPSTSRLMLIIAESGGNVRRLITDIRQHVKSAKEGIDLWRYIKYSMRQ